MQSRSSATIGGGVTAMLAFVAFLAIIFAPLINHIVWCINAASETGSAIALLIVGLLFPPLGWMHGVALWFGFTWI